MHKNMKSKIKSAVREMIFVSKRLRMTLFVPVFDFVPVEKKSSYICVYVYNIYANIYIQVKICSWKVLECKHVQILRLHFCRCGKKCAETNLH